MNEITRSKRNQTIIPVDAEMDSLKARLITNMPEAPFESMPVGTINGNCLDWIRLLPKESVDLLFLDPPYNLKKNFHGWTFDKQSVKEYTAWLNDFLVRLKPLLKKNASVYICGDWFSSASIYEAASENFIVQNRITWEREKGRGAKSNWKNSSEDWQGHYSA